MKQKKTVSFTVGNRHSCLSVVYIHNIALKFFVVHVHLCSTILVAIKLCRRH